MAAFTVRRGFMGSCEWARRFRFYKLDRRIVKYLEFAATIAGMSSVVVGGECGCMATVTKTREIVKSTDT